MSVAVSPGDLPARADAESYRALSSSAVVSLVGGVGSIFCFLDWTMALVPAIGILMGCRAAWQIRSNPEELTGIKLARAGIGLSLGFWALGWTWLVYAYMTEVPAGYRRIHYGLLQPAEATGQLVPPEALALDGQRVFIKGYVYPSAQKSHLQRFVLVRDNGSCCFGGPEPKLNDMIDVALVEPLRIDYSPRLFRIAGIFRVARPETVAAGDALYQIVAEYVH